MTELNEVIRMTILGCLFFTAAFASPLLFLKRDKSGIKFRSVWTLIMMIAMIIILSSIGTLIIISNLPKHLIQGG